MKFDLEKLLAIEHMGPPLLVTAGASSGKKIAEIITILKKRYFILGDKAIDFHKGGD